MSPPRRQSAGRSPWRALSLGRALILLPICTLAGCSLYEPRLPPHDPPPNQVVDTLLLEVPQRAVDALASHTLVRELELELAGQGAALGVEALPPGRHERLLAHQVVVGMSVREVIWCFLSHPTRVRDQGPPGGHTLIWEPQGLWHARYWVRFDEAGFANAAGRY
ncbi:MAG: hypothetical protein ACT4PU_06900 [Planctomycetota bacterium]